MTLDNAREIHRCEGIVFGQPLHLGPECPDCLLADVVQAFLESEQSPINDTDQRYLLRFYRTFPIEAVLADMTPAIVRAYLGGPGVAHAKAQAHLDVLRRFVTWAVTWGLLDATAWANVIVGNFDEFHPTLGRHR